MAEPQPYGLVPFRLRNQQVVARQIALRPWIKKEPALSGDDDAYEASRAQRFNILLSDTLLFENQRTHQVESVFSAAASAAAASAPSASSPPPPCMAPFQLVNHFPGSPALTHKAALVRALQRQYHGSSSHPFDAAPVAYYCPRGTRSEAESPTLAQLYKRMAALSSAAAGPSPVAALAAAAEGLRMPPKHAAANVWIVKPAGGGAPGDSFLANTPRDVAAAVACMRSDFVVQKYVERPFLVRGFKASVRLFVLLTDAADVYVHRSGLVLLASEPYAHPVAGQPMPPPHAGGGGAASVEARLAAHVTSPEVQARCPGFGGPGALAPGGVLSLDQLQGYVDAVGAAAAAAASAGAPDHASGVSFSPSSLSSSATAAAAAPARASALPPGVIHEAVLPRMKRIVLDAVRGAMAATMPSDPNASPLLLSSTAATAAPSAQAPGAPSGAVAAAAIDLAAAATAGHPRAGFRGRRCFELLAADFVLDEDLRPWLMGFSENPDLTLQSAHHPHVAALVESMAEEVVRLAVDPLYPAPSLYGGGGGGGGAGREEGLPTPGFDPAAYATARDAIPTGSDALEAASRAQTRLAGALARAAVARASGWSPSGSPEELPDVPLAPALPAPEVGEDAGAAGGGESGGGTGSLPGFELVFRSLAADDVESEAYAAMACAALSAGGGRGAEITGLSAAVAAQINEALCATLPPRSRRPATLPDWAFAGPSPAQHALAWLQAAGGAQAVLPPGHVLIETSSGGPLALQPPPSSPTLSVPSPQTVRGQESPQFSPSGRGFGDSGAGLGGVRDAESVEAEEGSSGGGGGRRSPRNLSPRGAAAQAAAAVETAASAAAASVEAAATAVAMFLARSGPDPLSTATRLALALQAAVASGNGNAAAAGMPGGLTNAALLSAVRATLPMLASAAAASRLSKRPTAAAAAAEHLAAARPSPAAPHAAAGSQLHSVKAGSAAGSGGGRERAKWSGVASRVDTGQHAAPKPKVGPAAAAAAAAAGDSSAEGPGRASQRAAGGVGRASSFPPAPSLPQHAGRGRTYGGGVVSNGGATEATPASSLRPRSPMMMGEDGGEDGDGNRYGGGYSGGGGAAGGGTPGFLRPTGASKARASAVRATLGGGAGGPMAGGAAAAPLGAGGMQSRIPAPSARKGGYESDGGGEGGRGRRAPSVGFSDALEEAANAGSHARSHALAAAAGTPASQELASLLADMFREQAPTLAAQVQALPAAAPASPYAQQPSAHSPRHAQQQLHDHQQQHQQQQENDRFFGARSGRTDLLPPDAIETFALPARENAMATAAAAIAAARSAAASAASYTAASAASSHHYPSYARPASGWGESGTQQQTRQSDLSSYTSLAAFAVSNRTGSSSAPRSQPAATTQQQTPAAAPGYGGFGVARPTLPAEVSAGQASAAAIVQRYFGGVGAGAAQGPSSLQHQHQQQAAWSTSGAGGPPSASHMQQAVLAAAMSARPRAPSYSALASTVAGAGMGPNAFLSSSSAAYLVGLSVGADSGLGGGNGAGAGSVAGGGSSSSSYARPGADFYEAAAAALQQPFLLPQPQQQQQQQQPPSQGGGGGGGQYGAAARPTTAAAAYARAPAPSVQQQMQQHSSRSPAATSPGPALGLPWSRASTTYGTGGGSGVAGAERGRASPLPTSAFDQSLENDDDLVDGGGSYQVQHQRAVAERERERERERSAGRYALPERRPEPEPLRHTAHAPVSPGGGTAAHSSASAQSGDPSSVAASSSSSSSSGGGVARVWVAVPLEGGSGPSGLFYYYNAQTRETVWEAPGGEGVVIVTQADVDALG